MECEQRKSEIRNKSALKKNRSRSGSSIFSCTKGQRDDSISVDNLEHQLELKSRENGELKRQNDELKKQVKKMEKTFMTMMEKMETTVILQNCKNVMMKDDGVFLVEETMDTTKLDLYIETVTKALNSAAEEKSQLEVNVRRLEESLDNVESKVNVMESHFSDLNAKLTRDFAKVAKQLTQHNLDIADQFSSLRTIFQRAQRSRNLETAEGDESRIIEEGINSIRNWSKPNMAVTASTLPVPAGKLNKMLTEKYGKVPVLLEQLFTSSSEGYYNSNDTFDNTVARWMVGWVRNSTENTADLLQRELNDLYVVTDNEG
ncbi:uncharacterized protein LOC132553524 [Ylistrum balloti]|uniref:uncharacterized protein LOC132553524 n=1 Tax=Ylistrum balloti TaxID=509963 RepID=UPI002905DCC1|nr:uncharacterized protein LOC132553524 [Ylistrum balloti]